ncbi:MAG: hypothetical protein K0Q73_4051 [Paenibacillus sp.]|jgi:hypothetical protein|nr:hypothetical protein [Paenibacillus sp.]
MSDIWIGNGIWQGWRLTADHAASSYNQPVLISPTGKTYGPGDIETPPPHKVSHQQLADLIGISRQALMERRNSKTVPAPDGEGENGRPYWLFVNIRHLIPEPK